MCVCVCVFIHTKHNQQVPRMSIFNLIELSKTLPRQANS